MLKDKYSQTQYPIKEVKSSLHYELSTLIQTTHMDIDINNRKLIIAYLIMYSYLHYRKQTRSEAQR